MSTRGRKPKPDAVKKLTGNPGKRALKNPANTSKSHAPALQMPKDLPDAAKKEWERVVPQLKRLGIVNGFDLTALSDYCLCVARLAECERDVTQRGILVEGDRGKVKNPALQLAREYRTQIQRWCSEFGLTPSSRGRMHIPEPEDEDPFEAYLRGDEEGEDDEEGEYDEDEEA